MNVASLLLKNESLFKLLWYVEKNALDMLIDDEIMNSMTYEFDSRDNSNPNCRIFFRRFIEEAETYDRPQLRIYPLRMRPNNIYMTDMMFQIDAILPGRLDNIKNGKRRHRLASEIIKSLNGQEVNMIGKVELHDMVMFVDSRFPKFDGWSLVFKTGIAAEG